MGRPPKKEEVISFRDFVRAGIVMSFYDQARENGQKHSAAVAQTVELIKQRNPKLPISETGVKRILAAWRPRGSYSILRFARSTSTEEERANHRWIGDQLALLYQKKGLKLPAPSDVFPPKSATIFKMSFGARPNYPRHNRKATKE